MWTSLFKEWIWLLGAWNQAFSCVRPLSSLAWKCLCAQNVVNIEMACCGKSWLAYTTSRPELVLGMNWNANFESVPIAQNQRLTSLMLMCLNESKSLQPWNIFHIPQHPHSMFQAFSEDWKLLKLQREDQLPVNTRGFEIKCSNKLIWVWCLGIHILLTIKSISKWYLHQSN